MTVDELAIALDAKCPGGPRDNHPNGSWDVYRTATKEWCVNVYAGTDQKENIRRKTLLEAMADALAYVPLPIVSRRPEVIGIDRYSIRKSGSKWDVCVDGLFVFGNIATKTKAQECIERAHQRQQDELTLWRDSDAPTILSGVEGVDFRYSTR